MTSPVLTSEPPDSVTLSAAVVVPAYRPGRALVDLTRALAGEGFAAIVVVDDGSGPEFRPVFDEIARLARVRLFRHAVNLGKGAALKSGMNCALTEFPRIDGVITADADGQHDPRDIVSVARAFAAAPSKLVIGAREFPAGIPLRSRAGNLVTRRAMRVLVGQSLSDTQSGLRAIPRSLMERLLRVPATGYEFELEMLIEARHLGVEIAEQPIRTIYEPGNPSSHFRPLLDSMRIYFVLLRFTLISLSTAVLDNLIFSLLLHASPVPLALAGARAVALTYNYTMVRGLVFHSHQPHRVVLPRYLALGAAYLCVSFAMMTFFARALTIGAAPAKMLAESLLFIANFAIQRDFVFARRDPRRSSAS